MAGRPTSDSDATTAAITATATPDQQLPMTSSLVHGGLGLRCGAFDVGAACAGFVYALVVASSLPGHRLVIGAETLTRITDPAVQAMVATGLIGALTALFTAYLNGRLAATREQFIDYCVDMLLSRVSSY